MIIKVIVTLKKSVLDPQGTVIQQTLDGMGFNNINEVRQGKFFEINMTIDIAINPSNIERSRAVCHCCKLMSCRIDAEKLKRYTI